jgi:anaerobic magnesium-protoporphyrin IX monomethyl ester cyclase
MKIALVNPPLVGFRRDPFGTIPSIPVGLLYVAAAARAAGHEVSIVDGFALAPSRRSRWLGEFEILGLGPDELALRIPADAEAIGISAHSGTTHALTLAIIATLRNRGATSIVVGGAFASCAPGAFLSQGASHVVVGDGERTFVDLLSRLHDAKPAVPGVLTPAGGDGRPQVVDDLDSLPLPAYDLADLEPYYGCGRAHGPLDGPYLPLVTSRGCACDCAFCSTPFLSGRRWRARSAANVVAEVAHFAASRGVTDFHVQDDSFAASPARAAEIARGLAGLGLGITFCLPSAVRVNDMSTALVDELVGGGLRYLYMAPESGSRRVRELMGKDVDTRLLVEVVSHAARRGLPTEACFVIGFPGEADADRRETLALVRELALAGLDDLAVFVMAPLPGSRCEGLLGAPPRPEGLNWSPRWRPDYAPLSRFRARCYAEFLAVRLARHPLRVAANLVRVANGRYRTKGEMVAGSLLRRRGRAS